MDAEDLIRAALQEGGIKSAKKLNEYVDRITTTLANAGVLWDGDVTTVEVNKARVPVEMVEAYGLTISLDANGNAVQISSTYSMAVIA